MCEAISLANLGTLAIYDVPSPSFFDYDINRLLLDTESNSKFFICSKTAATEYNTKYV